MKKLTPILLDNLIWLLLIAAILVFSLLTPNFMTNRNIIVILTHASVLGIMAIGQSFCLLTGNFDLSAESTLGLAGLIGAWLVTSADLTSNGSGWMLNPALAVLVMFAIGALIGVINGFLVTRLNMNNFIVTLAMLMIVRGMVMVVNRGKTITHIDPALRILGHDKLGAIPIAVLIMLLCFVVAFLITRYTQFGRDLYAVGGNRDAAQASGVDTGKRIRQVYIVSGLIAAFAGWIYVGRLSSAVASMGQGMIFEVTAAAVIGGISLFGGRGSIVGALGGVLLLSVIDSGLALLQVSSFWIETVRGLIILAAIIIDAQKVNYRRAVIVSAVTTKVNP